MPLEKLDDGKLQKKSHKPTGPRAKKVPTTRNSRSVKMMSCQRRRIGRIKEGMQNFCSPSLSLHLINLIILIWFSIYILLSPFWLLYCTLLISGTANPLG
jgi:hypothetical protein